MKLIVNRESLLNPLQQIVNVVEKKQTMPILSNVLIRLEKNRLQMTGTDLEVQISASTYLEQSEDGATTVPARKFLDLCRLLPAHAEIKLDLQDNKLRMVSGRSRFSLSTLPAEDYPHFSQANSEGEFQITSQQLKKALDKTLFCMANQDVRYYLNGLLLIISNSTLRFVASDGHRLAIYQETLQQETGLEHKIIIPRKGVLELSRLLANDDSPVIVQFSNNHIRVSSLDTVFLSKLIDAKYPDFSKVVNQAFHEPIALPRIEFKEALNRVAVLSNEKIKGLSLDFTPDVLKISAHNPDHDEAEEEIPISFIGEPLRISFNAQYLQDAVANLDSDVLHYQIAKNSSCCILLHPEHDQYQFLVMSMIL